MTVNRKTVKPHAQNIQKVKKFTYANEKLDTKGCGQFSFFQ